MRAPDHTMPQDRSNMDAPPPGESTQRWGGLASFLLPVAFIVPYIVYLTGNLRDAFGPLAYALADFLYGPVLAACLVTAIIAVRERVGERAPRRMNVGLSAAWVAAAAFVAVACIRSANRQYHVLHPDLHLEDSTTVLVVWATLVAGVVGAAWHFLGWTFVLVGWAGWTSRRLPRTLSALYVAGGAVSLFVYLIPKSEGGAAALVIAASIWQGCLLWPSKPGEAYVHAFDDGRPPVPTPSG